MCYTDKAMQRLKHILKLKPIHLFYVGSAVYFAYLQWGAGFADPDSFYHATVGALMARGHIFVAQFPWLTFTTFTIHFTDHELLYHILLVPFMYVASPLLATKIAAVIFALAFLAVFSLVLKQEGVRHRTFYLIVLLTAGPFIFRLNLAKASALALILFFTALYALWHNKQRLLFCIMALYVWTHAGWISIGVVYLTWQGIRAFMDYADMPSRSIKKLSTKYVHILCTDHTLGALILGTLTGIVFNPYFPHNIVFYWQQAIQIGLINYQSFITVGNEWYPFPLSELATQLAGIWIVAMAYLLLFVWHAALNKPPQFNARLRTTSARAMHSTLLAGLWFVFTLKSSRYVEYLAPTAVLALALIGEVLHQMRAYERLAAHLRARRAFYIGISVACVIYGSLWSTRAALNLHNNLAHEMPWSLFQKSGAYLSAHTPANSLVFNTNWSDTPMILFHDMHNRYITALDPTFFYLANPALFGRWTDISIGATHEPARAIYTAFHTPYILIKLPQDWYLNYELKKERGVRALFHDDESIIYEYAP